MEESIKPSLLVIYFRPDSGEMAKDLAARVRNDPRRVKTLSVWGNKFRDERDMEACKAIAIQRSLGNSDLIASCYRNFADGVEIHFLRDDGSFEDEDDSEVADLNGPVTEENQPEGAQDEPGDNQQADAGETQADTVADAGSGDVEQEEGQPAA